MDDEVLKTLAKRGIVVGPHGEWMRDPNYAGPNPPSDASIRYFNATAERGQYDVNARLKRQWVEQLWEVVQTVDREGVDGPWPFRAIFWIRLHGVIAELRNEWLVLFRTMEIDPDSYRPPHGSLGEIGLAIYRAVEAIRNAFTEDELVYADYRRHTEGHPTQASYDVRWSKKAEAIVDKHGVPAIDREVTVDEASQAIRRVLRAHPEEQAIAVAFARRIRGLLPALVEAMRRGAP